MMFFFLSVIGRYRYLFHTRSAIVPASELLKACLHKDRHENVREFQGMREKRID